MDTNYSTHQTPQFRVLSDRQIEKVYLATLECLNRTGVEVRNAEARDLLAEAGARVDGARVHIPPHIVQDAVAAAPRSFTLWGRNGEHCIQVVPDRVYFGPGLTNTYFVDPETGERRKVRRGDPGLTARVCDALENMDYVMGLGLIDDVTPTLAPVYEYAEMVANTSKPILPWAYSAAHQSPLVHTDEDLAKVLWAAERDVPIVYLGGPTLGATSPVTGASALVVYLAAALSGLAIIQLKKRGTAVCIGGVPQAMDLRSGRPSYGSPEMSLLSAAMSDISRWLGVPFMGTAGASEAKTLDLQAAVESAVQVVLSGLSGATLVHDVGFLDCADIGSLESLVMNDEIIAMTRRILRGVEVSDDTLLLDLIDQVGPGGQFMSERHTARHCRAEIWTPTLMDREPWVNWQAAGAQTMLDRIRAKLRDILVTHQPPPLPDGAAEEIETILQEAEEREGERRHNESSSLDQTRAAPGDAGGACPPRGREGRAGQG